MLPLGRASVRRRALARAPRAGSTATPVSRRASRRWPWRIRIGCGRSSSTSGHAARHTPAAGSPSSPRRPRSGAVEIRNPAARARADVARLFDASRVTRPQPPPADRVGLTIVKHLASAGVALAATIRRAAWASRCRALMRRSRPDMCGRFSRRLSGRLTAPISAARRPSLFEVWPGLCAAGCLPRRSLRVVGRMAGGCVACAARRSSISPGPRPAAQMLLRPTTRRRMHRGRRRPAAVTRHAQARSRGVARLAAAGFEARGSRR